MDIDTLTTFFMWCTVINGGLLAFWTTACLVAPNGVYKTQNWWFPMPRETFTVVMYSFIAVFKLIFLVFNLVPFLVLLILG